MWPHNPATRFRPPSATVVSAEPFLHGTGTLRCLQKEMATYRHWSVSLWRDPDDVPHCRILSPDKTEWWLISATLWGWRHCFVADQLWLMTHIREENRIPKSTSKIHISATLQTLPEQLPSQPRSTLCLVGDLYQHCWFLCYEINFSDRQNDLTISWVMELELLTTSLAEEVVPVLQLQIHWPVNHPHWTAAVLKLPRWNHGNWATQFISWDV